MRVATHRRDRQDKPGGRSRLKMIEARDIETELLDFLRREVFAPEVTVTAETDFIAAGFDSMSLVRVLVFVEQTYGLWIPESEINSTSLRDVRALAATVLRLIQQREG